METNNNDFLQLPPEHSRQRLNTLISILVFLIVVGAVVLYQTMSFQKTEIVSQQPTQVVKKGISDKELANIAKILDEEKSTQTTPTDKQMKIISENLNLQNKKAQPASDEELKKMADSLNAK